MNRNLLNTKQAADYIGMSPAFLSRDRWAGAQVPFVKLGHRSVRYRREDLDQFIESRVHSSTSSVTAGAQIAHA